MSDVARTLRHELIVAESDVERLRAEIEKLQVRLSHSFEKADTIKKLLAFYASDPDNTTQVELFANVPAPNVSLNDVPDRSHVRESDGVGSKAARVKAETSTLLRERGSVHRAKILEHLIGLGIMGHEKNPIASLAAYLSDNRTVFVTDGKGTFALRQTGHQEPPPAPTGAGYAEVHDAPASEPSARNENETNGEL